MTARGSKERGEKAVGWKTVDKNTDLGICNSWFFTLGQVLGPRNFLTGNYQKDLSCTTRQILTVLLKARPYLDYSVPFT